MPGLMDKVVGLDAVTYSVSTVSKMGVWETAVIAGRPGFFSRKNHRFVAHAIPGDPVDAQLMHMDVAAMVQTIEPARWVMDGGAIKDQLNQAAKYIGLRDPYEKRAAEQYQFFVGLMTYFYLVESLGEPGSRGANFAKQVGHLGSPEWQRVHDKAMANVARWGDDAKREAVTPATPAAMAILMTATARASRSIARANVAGALSEEQASVLIDVASRAAGAILAPDAAPDIRSDLLSPFADASVLDEDALAKPAEMFGETKLYWRSSDTIEVQPGNPFL